MAHEQLLYNDRAQVFSIPNRHVRHAKVFSDFRDVQPINTPAFSGTVNYRIPKNGNAIMKAVLKIVLTGLGGNGTSANARLCNAAGYNIIQDCRVQYNGQPIQQFNGTYMMLNHYLTYNHERQVANEKLVGIDTDANRETAFATGTQNFYVELPLCFTKNKDVALPVDLLRDDVSVDITLKSLKQICQFGTAGDGTATGSVSSMVLRLWYVNTDKTIMEDLAARSMREGLIYKVRDVQSMIEYPIASGSTQYDIKLSNFKGVIDSIMFVIRTASEVNGGAVGNDLDNFKQLSTFYIEGDGLRLTGTGIELEDAFVRYELMPMLYSSNPVPSAHSGVASATKYLYAFAFSLQPERIDSLGGLNISNINNPVLTIKFSSSLAANSLVDIFALTHNFLELRGGSIRKMFV